MHIALKRVLLVALLGVLVGVGARPHPAIAQGPEPDAPRVAHTDAEVLFPSAVRFGLIMTGTWEDVTRAVLRIGQPDTRTYTIPVDVRGLAVLLGPGAWRADYLWPISPARTFAPFTTVSYSWTISTADGETHVAEGAFIFEDAVRSAPTPATWRYTEPPLQLYTHNATLVLDFVRANVMRALERARAETGIDRTFRIVLYDAGVDFCLRDADGLYTDSRYVGGTRRDCDPGAAVHIYRAHDLTLLRRPDATLDSLQDRLVELIAGELYAALWADSSPPAWFREGLIQLYGLTTRQSTLALARDAARAGGLLPLAVMSLPPDDDPAVTRLWRAQSYLMTLYLAGRFGARAPFDLARDVAMPMTFEEALAARFGIGLNRLYDDWRRWLLSPEAVAAVRWTPYLPATPTPTPLPSATPTRTPTADVPTATRTAMPTLTPFPVRSNTPIPRTPTNTPRPPGSLRTPTPVPAPPESGGGLCPGAAIPPLIIGIVSLRAWVWRRTARRRATET